MTKRFFNPYIGSHYQDGLINNKKVLVLGASHYCLYDSSSKTFNCPVWEECTSYESKDSSKYDLCCPYYKSLGWYELYDYVQLSNSPKIELENYLSDGGYDAYNNFTLCLLDLLNIPDAQSLWERLAFVNYVQYFLPTPTTPSLTNADIGSFEALIEYIEKLKPDIIIVWGTKITDHFNHNYIKKLVNRLEVRTDNYFWDYENNGHKCLLLNPYHPCDTPPWNYWSKNIDSFRNAFSVALGLSSAK